MGQLAGLFAGLFEGLFVGRFMGRIFRDLNRREYDSINRVSYRLPLCDLQGYVDQLPLS